MLSEDKPKPMDRAVMFVCISSRIAGARDEFPDPLSAIVVSIFARTSTSFRRTECYPTASAVLHRLPGRFRSR
jgi:hypothetical protein